MENRLLTEEEMSNIEEEVEDAVFSGMETPSKQQAIIKAQDAKTCRAIFKELRHRGYLEGDITRRGNITTTTYSRLVIHVSVIEDMEKQQ